MTAPELFGRLPVLPPMESFLDAHDGLSATDPLLKEIGDRLSKSAAQAALR